METGSPRAESGSRPTVALIGSVGGHIDLLVGVRDAFADYRRVWLVEESARADGLREDGEIVHLLPPYARNPMRGNLLGNLRVSAGVLQTHRPSVVVASGAGMSIPFSVLARLIGTKLIFVETMARVDSPSLTGRVLSRFATTTFVQWNGLATAYPRAVVCQPALLEAATDRSNGSAGEGTFVGLGTHVQPFDRLIQLVDDAVGEGFLPQPVTVQRGVSDYQPQHFQQGERWLLPDDLRDAVHRAKYVVCHAGSGFISMALRAGRRPMVLPREKGAGEHVDDHQFQLADQLFEMGLIVRLQDQITRDHVREAEDPVALKASSELPSLSEALERALSSTVPS